MNELIICGDSYMSPKVDYVGKHFSEIVSNHLGLPLVVYSRSGISNGGIALQILKAIKQNPKLIIFNLTYHDRIEFKLDGFPESDISFDSLCYDINTTEISTQSRRSGILASDNLVSLLGRNHTYPKNKLKAIRNYFQELYCQEWKEQTDIMMMYSVLHTLHKTSIPYIMVHNNLALYKSPCTIDWLDDKNNISEQLVDLFTRPIEVDPGFHTSVETQQEIAQYVLNHYNKYF